MKNNGWNLYTPYTRLKTTNVVFVLGVHRWFDFICVGSSDCKIKNTTKDCSQGWHFYFAARFNWGLTQTEVFLLMYHKEACEWNRVLIKLHEDAISIKAYCLECITIMFKKESSHLCILVMIFKEEERWLIPWSFLSIILNFEIVRVMSSTYPDER